MKTIILMLVLYISVASVCSAQADRIYSTDSVKSGRASIDFTVNSRHNYNTIVLKTLISSDSVRVYGINEYGDTTAVALRNLNTYTDLPDNLIFGLTGNYEFLVMHPNLYKVVVKYVKATIAKTIYVRRRGNNLK